MSDCVRLTGVEQRREGEFESHFPQGLFSRCACQTRGPVTHFELGLFEFDGNDDLGKMRISYGVIQESTQSSGTTFLLGLFLFVIVWCYWLLTGRGGGFVTWAQLGFWGRYDRRDRVSEVYFGPGCPSSCMALTTP
jgi:hypothetical protein